MKALAVCIIVYLLFFTDVVSAVHFDTWQLPLWIADTSWTGLELIGVLAAIIIFVAAAIFTPPDVISQIALAIPLLLLYEVSIVLCKLVEKKGS